MHTEALEVEALDLYHAAKLDPVGPSSVGVLVRRLLGTPIKAAPMRTGREGALVRVGTKWRIYVRSGLAIARAKWVACHELAHWALDRHGTGTERECDALGAAIVAPAPRYVAIRGRVASVVGVAAALGSTQSLAALREGEVLHVPVALVEPHRIVARGGFGSMFDETAARNLASIEGRGIVQVRIDDEPDRFALMLRENRRRS